MKSEVAGPPNGLDGGGIFGECRKDCTVRGKTTMEVEEFLNVINECDVLRDDIDDIRGRVLLTKVEGGKLAQATEHVDKAKSILTDLFPTIRSLDDEVREDLSEELSETD
jgi:hypothetical protein